MESFLARVFDYASVPANPTQPSGSMLDKMTDGLHRVIQDSSQFERQQLGQALSQLMDAYRQSNRQGAVDPPPVSGSVCQPSRVTIDSRVYDIPAKRFLEETRVYIDNLTRLSVRPVPEDSGARTMDTMNKILDVMTIVMERV